MKVPINSYGRRISLADRFFSLGSCFSEEISNRLIRSGLDGLSNPFGTVYNSFSIQVQLEQCVSGTPFMSDELFFHQDSYGILDHSTQFDGNNPDNVLENSNHRLKTASEWLKKSTVFFLTPGTSVVYKYRHTGKISANCHKLPQMLFERQILSVEENKRFLAGAIHLIRSVQPEALIFLSLSPVRHSPSDPSENQYSKSILRTALEETACQNQVIYFPSYEIMMDELRDYRFYRTDGVHLKKSAIRYILKRFIKVYLNEWVIKRIKEIDAIDQFLKHRPQMPQSLRYLEQLSRFLNQAVRLYQEAPGTFIYNRILEILLLIRICHPDQTVSMNENRDLIETIQSRLYDDAFQGLYPVEQVNQDLLRLIHLKKLTGHLKPDQDLFWILRCIQENR